MGNSVLFVAFSLLLTFADVMSNQPNAANCPKIYKRYSTTHTRCQPKNTTCHIYQNGVSLEEAKQIVDLHNKYRSAIATQGKESNGLPPASNMMYMEWDQELANVAQKQTQRCVYAHDESNQRQVRNFRVGQNIAKQTNSVRPTEADWALVIGGFYAEIKNFHKSQMCGPYIGIPEEVEIGHFTQEIWATSFRVGCGYTMHKDGDKYIRLYSCNYGPGGNIKGVCIYEKGRACSKCPKNTHCTKDAKHPGLCQRNSEEAIPYVPLTVPTIFNCNFREPNSPDCGIYKEGVGSWGVFHALGGPYIETVLQPGQNSTIVFNKKLIGTNGAKELCILATYRKGPELAKNPQKNAAKGIFVLPSSDDYTVYFNFKDYDAENRQKFGPKEMRLGWADPSIMKISFAVPKGATPQFFNLQSVVGFNDKCPKLN